MLNCLNNCYLLGVAPGVAREWRISRYCSWFRGWVVFIKFSYRILEKIARCCDLKDQPALAGVIIAAFKDDFMM